jgi:Holliday junction resolvasome RuvABC endonuclease subunit
MRIMGLDLSMSATGVAFPDGSTAVIKPRGEGDARLLSIGQQMEHALRLARPQLAVVEDIQGAMHGTSNKVIPMVHGVVRLALMRAGVPYVVVNPSTLKTFALGSQGDKAAMILAAYKRAGREFTDDNECDAFWLRAAGHAAYGEPVVDLPKAHTEALRKVVWPRIAGAGEPLEHAAKPARRKRAVAA